MKTSQRASLLVLTLLVCALLLVLGAIFLASRASDYSAAKANAQAVQARALAWAGLEDARLKFLYDYNFPPKAAEDQPEYEVVEAVTDPEGEVVGYYCVTIRQDTADDPVNLLVVESTGILGSLEKPQGRRKLVGLFDLRPTSATYFRWLTVVDKGAL